MHIERFMKNKIFALLVFAPDPFIALYFKRLYEANFKDEINGLLVQVNGARPEIVDFIADLYKDEFVVKHYDHSNQGIGFDELYKKFTGDILMTLCSDNFIYKKGVVTKFASMIGEYDVIGSKGLHASPTMMADKIAQRIGFCRINPFMSFWNAKKLREIEPFTFQKVGMEKGSILKALNMLYEGEGRLDVMTDMSIKFMSRDNKAFIYGADNPPDWIHASGLSSGVYGHLMHPDGKNLAGIDKDFSESKLSKEFLAWLYHCYEMTVKDCSLKKFNKAYLQAIRNKCHIMGYDFKDIEGISNAKKVEFGLW